MPIKGSYEWTQDEESIELWIPLKGTSPKAADVFTAPTVLKVSYPPYLIDLDLSGEIDETASTATVHHEDRHGHGGGGKVLKVRLVKANGKTKTESTTVWKRLSFEGSEEERKSRRSEALRRRDARIEEQKTRAREYRWEEERRTLRTQMDIERNERQAIDDRKAAEKKREEDAMYEHFQKMELQRQQQQQQGRRQSSRSNHHEGRVTVAPTVPLSLPLSKHAVESNPSVVKREMENCNPRTSSSSLFPNTDGNLCSNGNSSIDDARPCERPTKKETQTKITRQCSVDLIVDPTISNEPRTTNTKTNTTVRTITTTTNKERKKEPASDDEKEEEEEPIPGVRTFTKITFRHTPRIFKTPIRESTMPKERAFIAKNRPHLHKNGLLNHDSVGVGVEETDPLWLKSKGDGFCRKGDYRSAIHAYSSAVEATGTGASEDDDIRIRALSNRALCYLQLSEPGRCLRDCQETLAVLGNDKNDNYERDALRRKLRLRMGTAHFQRDELDDAISCFEEAQSQTSGPSTFTPECLDFDHELTFLRRFRVSVAAKTEGDEILRRTAKPTPDIALEALARYDTALEIEPGYVRALCNRAACRLWIVSMAADAEETDENKQQQTQYDACVADCTRALDLLAFASPRQQAQAQAEKHPQSIPEPPKPKTSQSRSYPSQTDSKITTTTTKKTSKSTGMGGVYGSLLRPVPRPHSDERRTIVVALLCRRATAYAGLGRYGAACDSLKVARQLENDPQRSQDIERDLAKLAQKIQSMGKDGREEENTETSKKNK